jgi:hypothetical protein
LGTVFHRMVGVEVVEIVNDVEDRPRQYAKEGST